MILASTRWQVIASVMGTVVFLVVSPARSGESDSLVADADRTAERAALGNKLAEARIKYELEMEEMRAEIREDLQREETRLRNKSETLEKIQAVMAELESFNATGEWPTLNGIRGQQNRNERLRRTLVDAYEDARKDYLIAKEDNLVREVVAECAALDEEDDVVPWSDNQVGDLDEVARTFHNDGKAFDVTSLGLQSYRIDVQATRLDGEGPFRLVLPVPGGQRVEVTVEADRDGKAQALLSVRNSLVSADLGVSRPIAAAVANGNPDQLLCLASNAKYSLDSVRIKPIFRRQHLEPKEREQRTTSGPEQVRRAQMRQVNHGMHLTKGSEWSGTHIQNGLNKLATIKCFYRKGNDVKISTRRFGGAGYLDFWFRIRGSDLVLMSVVPVGHPSMILKNWSGGGKISGDSMQFSYKLLVQERGKPNRAGNPVGGGFSVTLDN